MNRSNTPKKYSIGGGSAQSTPPRATPMSESMIAAGKPRWMRRAPTPADVTGFLESQRANAAALEFSYSEKGRTRTGTAPPPGYNLDHNRTRIGEGEADFVAACEALRGWRMFPAPLARILPGTPPIEEGMVVVMLAEALGFHWLNACRIVYVIAQEAPVRRCGFAYGTLPAHVEQGEERFSVELHADGSVWYDLLAFSRPRYWPVRIAKPLARRLQARFVRESQAAMRAAVPGSGRVVS